MKGRAIDALSECACTGPANPRGGSYVAYRLVHCLAILSCSALLVIYWVAILPTRGSAEKETQTIKCLSAWEGWKSYSQVQIYSVLLALTLRTMCLYILFSFWKHARIQEEKNKRKEKSWLGNYLLIFGRHMTRTIL